MLKARDKWCRAKTIHHPRRLSRIGYNERSTCRDRTSFRRGEVFRLNEKTSSQFLIGVGGGIGRRLSGAALLSNGPKSNSPTNQYGRCRYGKSHEFLLGFMEVWVLMTRFSCQQEKQQ